MQFELKALTDIWTGGADRSADKLHLSGLKGSLRWWYEALVRGLGSYACDPTQNGCQLKPKIIEGIKSEKERRSKVKKEICAACYLFGCTGWSGKFILRVIIKGKDGSQPIATDALSARNSFVLEFIPKKEMETAEDELLRAIIKLIIGYGALGGKTVFKPSEKDFKNTKLHHRDFGIVGWDKGACPADKINLASIKNTYLKDFNKDKPKQEQEEQETDEWPDLRRFWFVRGKHLTRQEHNQLVGRNDRGSYERLMGNDAVNDVFLGGFISRDKGNFPQLLKTEYEGFNAASKKMFSFHGPAPIERCFGYVAHNQDLDAFIEKVIALFPQKLGQTDFHKGADLLNRL